MAKSAYSSFCKPYTPQREPLKTGGDGPYFRNGAMNREPHGAPTGPEVVRGDATAKTVHVYHYKDRT